MRRLIPLVLALVSASCNASPPPIVFGHVADFSGTGKAAADEAQRAMRGFLAGWPEQARPKFWRSEKLPNDDAGWKPFAEKAPMGIGVLFGGPLESIRKRPEMAGRPIAYAGPEIAWRGLGK